MEYTKVPCPYCWTLFEVNRGVNWRNSENEKLSGLYCSVQCLDLHKKEVLNDKVQ